MSVEVRISLAGAEFPADPREAPLVALQPALDTASRASAAYVGKGENFDWGMPGALFVDDTIPKYNGYATLAKTTVTYGAQTFTSVTELSQFTGIDSAGTFVLGANGTGPRLACIRRNLSTLALESYGIPLAISSYAYLSSCVLNGSVYVLPSSPTGTYALQLFTFIESGGGAGFTALTPTPPVGGFPTIRGMAALGTYLLLVSDDSVFYSVPGQPTDFAGVGAGNFTPQSFEGRVVAVREIANGVIIYTTLGAWAITQTFNGANPFKSKQLSGLSGTLRVASEPGGDTHYAHTSSGLYAVSIGGIAAVLSHLWRSISNEAISTYNTSTRRFVFSTITPGMDEAFYNYQDIRLSLVDSRYLVIHRENKSLNYVYDTQLKRLGKIIGTYVGAVNLGSANSVHQSSESMMYFFTQVGGCSFYTADNIHSFTSPGYAARNGVVAVGPIVQQRNDRQTTITQVSLTNLLQSFETLPEVTVLSSPGDISQVTHSQIFTSIGNSQWLGRITGRYLYVIISGAIDVSNLLVKVTANGH
jgi:hypothetical protein